MKALLLVLLGLNIAYADSPPISPVPEATPANAVPERHNTTLIETHPGSALKQEAKRAGKQLQRAEKRARRKARK